MTVAALNTRRPQLSANTRVLVVGVLSLFVVACGDTKNASPISPTAPPIAVALPTYTLSGVISDATPAGVAPLEGVQVWTGPQHVTTDGNGYYSISGLTASSGIFVTKVGYKQVRKSLTLNGDARLDLQLEPLDKYSFSGVVSEETPTGLVPVEGALVTGSWDYPVTTDRNGFFDIPGGLYESDDYDYSVYVIKDGYQTFMKTLTVSDDTRLDVHLVRR